MNNYNTRIPDFQKIMLPFLRLLADGQPKPLNEVMPHLTKYFKLTEEDLRIRVPSGKQKLFRNRVGWSRTYLKNAGLVFYPSRGVYQITEDGKKFLESNPKDLNVKSLKKMPKYKAWVKTFNQGQTSDINLSSEKETEIETPEVILGSITQQLNKQLAIELLERLKENSSQYFEEFVIQLLRKMEYGGFREGSSKVTGKVGDEGVDGIIYQDRLGLEAVYVQAKKFTSGSVGSPDIRNFIGSLALKGVNKGVFLTTSFFSEAAIKTANESKQQKIVLIDGKKLASLAIEYNLGVQIDDIIELKKIDIDFFEE